MVTFLLSLLIAAAVAVADQWTKSLVLAHMAENESAVVLPGVLRWTYIENSGAAFGILQNHRWIFLVFSVVMIALIFAYIAWKYWVRKFPVQWLELISLAAIAGGGVGNMIDRVARGSVVDFVDVICFPFWHYIFNVADIFVTCGCFLLILALILDDVKSRKKEEKEKQDKSDEQV